MRLISVKLEKIRNSFYIKIPDLIVDSLNLKKGNNIEISLHNEPSFKQQELWNENNNINKMKDINEIILNISEDLHTLNMYNKIYIPEKYRFFFPLEGVSFYILTNIGKIKSNITSNGYIIKGIRSWIEINGPLEPNDKMYIRIVDFNNKLYEMKIIKDKIFN
tara:strand:+ start:174 stop:662 length:489 start_codon:yes stop_codon:yes gene_type:complete